MEKLTFDQLPEAIARLLEDNLEIKRLLVERGNAKLPVSDQWFAIDELCAYLPGNPAKATIYSKVQKREIPHKKVGNRLAFLKSDIDQWINSYSRKTTHEIASEAERYLQKKRGHRS